MQKFWRDLPHLYIQGGGKAERYTSPLRPHDPNPPPRDRVRHAKKLTLALEKSFAEAREIAERRDPDLVVGIPGFYLEFDIAADQCLALNRIQNDQQKIELVAVRRGGHNQDDILHATAFLPKEAEDHFLKRVRDYASPDLDGKNYPKNAPLIARIEDIRLGDLTSLFTDQPSPAAPLNR